MSDTAASSGLPLPDEALRHIASSGVVRTFPKSTILIAEGDVGDSADADEPRHAFTGAAVGVDVDLQRELHDEGRSTRRRASAT